MIFAMLQNTSTNRFHPIIFGDAPMPGGMDNDADFRRYRSQGHHTEGFDTREEAQADIDKICAEHGFTDSKREYEWDGKETPAMVEFFPNPFKSS